MIELDKMKDSGIEWIGKIPNYWKIVKMKSLFRNLSIKNHPNATVLSLYRDLGIVPKDSRDDNHNVTSENTEQYKFVHKGNLVINKMKSWQGSLAISDYEGIVSPAYYVCAFRNNEIDKRYYHHLLRSKAYAQHFECLSTGMRVGQWDLSIEDFMMTPALVPPINEQKLISSFLDTVCTDIDTAITEAKASIEDYKLLKQSIITKAVTKGLNINTPMKDSGIEWIGKIPVNWNRYKLSYGFNLIGSGTTPKSENENYYNGDIPWLQSGDINGSIVTETSKRVTNIALNETPSLKIYKAPFIAIAMYGASIANISVVTIDSCTNQACCVLSNPSDGVDTGYVFFVLNAAKKQLLLSSRGGTQPNISQDIIKKLVIPIPPIKEQNEIANYLNEKCTEIDSLITEKEAMITDLEAYKKSLIFEVVTGKRKVC